jgi:CheY-like chemotaxis protein
MKKITVGIFESDKVNRFIYEKTFDRHKDRVDLYLFDNPDKGLEVAKNIAFDIVFIDLHFWGEDFAGVSILHRLKATASKEVFAIAMTSLLQEGDIERTMEAGFGLCLENPVALSKLEQLSAHLLSVN